MVATILAKIGLFILFSAITGGISNIGATLLSAFRYGIGMEGFKLPGFASGTNFAPGGLSLVGERGPELVNLPRGSQVIPNGGFGGGQLVAKISGTDLIILMDRSYAKLNSNT